MGFGLALTTTNRWPGGIIPFEIDATAFPAGSIQRQRVIQAINAWNNASIIRLVPRSAPPNAETDFARFVSGAACNTASGRQSTGGQHNINCVTSGSGFSAGNMMHEIGHCLGLLHEQQRPDRNLFVSINTPNIQAPTPAVPNPAGNFTITNTACPLGRYDCGSIMHYGPTAFGNVVGGVAQLTVSVVNPAVCANIGQRIVPSGRDIAAARALYESITGLTEKVTLADSSDRSPTITSDGARLFIAWKGANNENLNVMFSTDGGLTFIGKHTSGETSDDAAALAGHGGRVFIAWTGEGDGELNVARVDRTNVPTQSVSGLNAKVTLKDTSDCRPALASDGSRLFLAWTGQGDGNLNILTSTDAGATWSGKFVFDETSSHAPALASHDGELFIAWKGSGNENLNVARVDFALPPAPPTVTGLSNKVIFSDTSDHGPSLVSQGGLLFLGWTGQGERKLNLLFPAGGPSCNQKFVFESDSSDDALALTLHAGRLVLAWRGSGNENLNVAKVAFLARIPPPVIV